MIIQLNEKISNLTRWLHHKSGLYSLVLSSKLPDAKKFKRWVTSEVLPSIRKTGGYAVPTTEKTLADLTAGGEREPAFRSACPSGA